MNERRGVPPAPAKYRLWAREDETQSWCMVSTLFDTRRAAEAARDREAKRYPHLTYAIHDNTLEPG